MKTMISASVVGVIVPFRTELRKEHGRIGFEGDASGRFLGKHIVQVTTQKMERAVCKRPLQEPESDPLSSTRGKGSFVVNTISFCFELLQHLRQGQAAPCVLGSFALWVIPTTAVIPSECLAVIF